MNNEHGRKLFALSGACEVTLDRAVARGRRYRFVTDLYFLVVRFDSLRPRVVRRKALKDRRDRQSTDGKLCRIAKEGAAVNVAVLVLVK